MSNLFMIKIYSKVKPNSRLNNLHFVRLNHSAIFHWFRYSSVKYGGEFEYNLVFLPMASCFIVQYRVHILYLVDLE